MDAFLVPKAQFEVFYLPEILLHMELQVKIDILLSCLILINSKS